jgi:hypothetical protein
MPFSGSELPHSRRYALGQLTLTERYHTFYFSLLEILFLDFIHRQPVRDRIARRRARCEVAVFFLVVIRIPDFGL